MASYWKQLSVTGRAGHTVPPTAFGEDILIPERRRPKDELGIDMAELAFDGRLYPTDQTGQYRCPHGHVSGLNLLSEVYVDRAQWDGSDISATEDLVGVRRGLLVPSPIFLITQRCYRLLAGRAFKGFKVEIARFVA
jgi:hypothetical protein